MWGFTVDAGLLARSQYSEGPATGHLETGFSWFHCVYMQMLSANLYDIYHCCVYSEKLLMLDRGTVRNM